MRRKKSSCTYHIRISSPVQSITSLQTLSTETYTAHKFGEFHTYNTDKPSISNPTKHCQDQETSIANIDTNPTGVESKDEKSPETDISQAAKDSQFGHSLQYIHCELQIKMGLLLGTPVESSSTDLFHQKREIQSRSLFHCI